MDRRVENVETDRKRPFTGPDKDALGPDYEWRLSEWNGVDIKKKKARRYGVA